MKNKNISDLIEAYLKELLTTNDEYIEIRRAEIADYFQCVPSQINYVINTRFTIPKGYKVESKRGGGGYIRIVKINLIYCEMEDFAKLIDSRLTESEGFAILEELHDNGIITKRERELLKEVLKLKGITRSKEEQELRASLMLNILERLAYDE